MKSGTASNIAKTDVKLTATDTAGTTPIIKPAKLPQNPALGAKVVTWRINSTIPVHLSTPKPVIYVTLDFDGLR